VSWTIENYDIAMYSIDKVASVFFCSRELIMIPFCCNSSMTIFNINITNKSLRPVPRKGLYTVLRNVDFDIKGKWSMNVAYL
jgi:hypothetical protein